MTVADQIHDAGGSVVSVKLLEEQRKWGYGMEKWCFYLLSGWAVRLCFVQNLKRIRGYNHLRWSWWYF